MVDFSIVREFERQIAEFFGAPYAVAVDSCTHGLELCLRYKDGKHKGWEGQMMCKANTYISVPMLANKLGLKLTWDIDEDGEFETWKSFYGITPLIYDAAVYWEKDGYKKHMMVNEAERFMCISFQYKKHLSLGRGGMILCPDEQSAATLRKMAYDGREPGIPWREQDIDTMGYHYYMTPETAALGLQKLPEAITTQPRIWSWEDYPDLTKMKIWQKH